MLGGPVPVPPLLKKCQNDLAGLAGPSFDGPHFLWR